MTHSGLKASLVACLVLALAVQANGMKIEVREGRVEGRIFSGVEQTGVPNLTVKLIPPKTVPFPEKVTTTDQDGKFSFANVEKGRYLLEVSQGVTLLYRNVLDTRVDTNKVIELRRKE